MVGCRHFVLVNLMKLYYNFKLLCFMTLYEKVRGFTISISVVSSKQIKLTFYFKFEKKICRRKRCTIQHYVSSDPDSSESESAIFISRPSHSSTPIDKPKTETTKIGFNLNGDSKKKKIVHLSVISSRSSESVNFVSKRATNALTGEEVESYMYVKDAKKCKGSLVESYLNDQVPEGKNKFVMNFYQEYCCKPSHMEFLFV